MARNMAKIAENITSTITLNDGVVMPLFGLGVWRAKKNGETEEAVTCAIKNGYRLIDTAKLYQNEADVGRAVNKSGLERDDLFVVTKCWTDEHGYDSVKKACKESLKRLDIGHIDLYLIHSPYGGKLVQTYKGMCELKKEGIVRSVGVSNFGIQHLEGLKKEGLPTPSVNQIELHTWMRRKELVNYCRKEGITVMGYSPLVKAQRFEDSDINELAKKYNKSAAQMMIRWSVQNGFITIPKSVKKERIIENSQVFDWTIDDEDFKTMAQYPTKSCKDHDPTTSPFDGS